jgi:hypothetical protein
MRRRSVLLLGLFFVILAGIFAAALAQTDLQSEDSPFKNWLTLTDYLRSKGIEPSKVNWQPIETMCLGLKQSDESAYNKCKYEKVRDQSLHQADRQQCYTRAVAQYPDRLAQIDTTETIREINASGKVRVFERVVPPISTIELSSLRDAAVVQCMQSLGWISANDAFNGKRYE